MGEYAEMMLDGTCCEACGEFMGGGSGFPQYCSKACARSRGFDTGRPKETRPHKIIFTDTHIAETEAFVNLMLDKFEGFKNAKISADIKHQLAMQLRGVLKGCYVSGGVIINDAINKQLENNYAQTYGKRS